MSFVQQRSSVIIETTISQLVNYLIRVLPYIGFGPAQHRIPISQINLVLFDLLHHFHIMRIRHIAALQRRRLRCLYHSCPRCNTAQPFAVVYQVGSSTQLLRSQKKKNLNNTIPHKPKGKKNDTHKQAVQSDHSLAPSLLTNPPHASAPSHSQSSPRARAPSPASCTLHLVHRG
jgi:hypothetical protein